MKLFFFFTIAILIVGCSSPKRTIRRGFELELNNPFFRGVTPMEVYFPEEKRERKKRIEKKVEKKIVIEDNSKKVKKKIKKEIKKEKKVAIKDKKRSNNKRREEVVEYALTLNGKKRVPGKKFRNDCSGFVRYVYDHFNIDLFNLEREELRERGRWVNGSKLIYKYSKKHGKVFSKKPKLGDFIFFDNTTDRNRDGRLNDLFTHIAIVIKIEDNGTIHYIHKSNRGINIQKMNLKYINSSYIKVGNKKKKVNSYLRKVKKHDNKKTKYLSGQMFKSFGSIFK